MGVTTATFDQALKDTFEPMAKDQLNLNTSAFFNKVLQTELNIELGKRVVKPAPYGVNGGFGAGAETAPLPTPGGNKFAQFISGIKDLRGVISFTDKVMKASKGSRAAWESAMTTEMDGILKHAKMSYGRMAYTDGTGKLTLTGIANASLTVAVASTQYLIEGMTIDIYDVANALIVNGTGRRIKNVNRAAKTIVLDGTATVTTIATGYITEQGALNNELTGMEAVYAQTGTLYGLAKADYSWLIPYSQSAVGAIDDGIIVDTINFVEDFYGSTIDLLVANPAVYSEYFRYLRDGKRTNDTLILAGGFKALTVNAVPMVKDKNVKSGALKLLDTTQWKMHTFGDWGWMDDDGKILKWVSNYAMYQAILIKYAELICDHPGGQAELTGITTSTTLFD